ncbi:hypothetical protein BGZ96_006181 [Linnemannia gamsii]|uniref:Uncharacterized protein n=1 Tax=Linnemannia gamsii TaxID=64522 RepID=A0ABQ7K2T6_9FUNG|nr:hypothetical protein BGZ96_006181 [Linnemannia gamsii]
MNHRALNSSLHVDIAVAVATASVTVTEGTQADGSTPTSGNDSKNGAVIESPKSADGGLTSGPLASGTNNLDNQADRNLT